MLPRTTPPAPIFRPTPAEVNRRIANGESEDWLDAGIALADAAGFIGRVIIAGPDGAPIGEVIIDPEGPPADRTR